jgi:hypothetical protein
MVEEKSMNTTENQIRANKAPKPCPRCGGAAGAGTGGSACQCKKSKEAAIAPGTTTPPGTAESNTLAPCDAPIKTVGKAVGKAIGKAASKAASKAADQSETKSGCGCLTA